MAAKVNGEEITVHQINLGLQSLGEIPPAQADAARKQALERLIDQELLLQQAKSQKLDRDPQITQAIEAAKRQIIVQGYLERLVGQAVKPKEDEVSKFYGDNPLLFAKRRIYRLQELTIADAAIKPELEARLKTAKKLEEVAAWLSEKNIRFGGGVATRPAEQLPPELLGRYAEMTVGQVFLFQAGNQLGLAQLLAYKDEPVDLKNATPAIEKFLVNRVRADTAQKEVKRLRDVAKIEYEGSFAGGAAQPATPAPAATTESDAVKKGLSGL